MKRFFHKKVYQRLMAGLLLIGLLCTGVLQNAPVFAKTSDEAKQEQEELERRLDELDAQLQELATQEEKELEYYTKLLEEANIMEEQIDTITASIRQLDEDIRDLEDVLKKADAEYADILQKLKERVVILYKNGNASMLELLFSSKSWSDFSMKAELVKAVTAHDQKLMDEVYAHMEATRAQRVELREKKELVCQERTKAENKRGELWDLEVKSADVLESLQKKQIEVKNTRIQTQDEIAALDDEIARLIEEEKNKPDPYRPVVTGTDFTWPCPGYVYISSYWGDGRGHKGVDLAAYRGTPILAAQAGVVTRANSTDEWGSGWGYHVMIWHNDTYSTLYAHASALAVYEGQYVEKGQVIAYVGNTGNSFGNHLHFEVWQNGVRIDPAPFLGI